MKIKIKVYLDDKEPFILETNFGQDSEGERFLDSWLTGLVGIIKGVIREKKQL